MKIQNSMPSIGRTFFSINRKNEEIHHKVIASFDRFLIPVWLIENTIQSIERNSQLIETMKNFIIEFLPESICSRFLFDQSKRTFDRSKGILDRSKLAKLNFSQNFRVTVFDVFPVFHKKHLLILWMNIHKSNIMVFKIIIKNPNNARNLENKILIRNKFH